MKTKIHHKLHHHLKRHLRLANKHARRAKHVLTKRKVVKRHTAHRIIRGTFVIIAAVSTGAVAFAIATTRPVVNLQLTANVKPHDVSPATNPPGAPDQVGRASWYALGLPEPDALTCASRRFPRGTYLQVKDLYNGRTVICLVNDYGPEIWTGRVLDLSRGSFRVLQDLGTGTIPVEIRVVVPAAQPTGFNFNVIINRFVAAFTGYGLCEIRHSSSFCNQNRQKTWSF